MQAGYLSIPEYFDNFVGMSCSEIEYGAAVQGGNPLSLLCAKSVGDTDFREYTTVVVPYCTQDVHIGDAPSVSYDGNNNAIHHVGAHNMIRTLNWVFQNFPNPTHVFLTGCSAGGTAVPIAYDLINKHYNTFLKGGGGPFPRAVNINAIMDSSVYLTPSYFLQNGFPNWNPGSIMKKLNFNYNKYKYQENYPDYILKRGSNHDKWGFVTHSTDPISLMFYQYMSGNGDDDGDGGRLLASTVLKEGRSAAPEESIQSDAVTIVQDEGRRMDNDLQSQWWSEITNSIDYVKKKHKNVDAYIINSEGHCSFGLYYPLQEEGFEEWASPIMKEGVVIGNRRPSVASFFTSLAFGAILIFLTRRLKCQGGKKDSLMENGDAGSSYNIDETSATLAKRVNCGPIIEKVQAAANPMLTKCQSWPWTAGYLLTTTVYFISMLITQGFAHPLDNPGFGPSAVGLSTFGINNPALIVYRMEHFRLITSSFLCSGVTTFFFVIFTAYKTGLEAAMTDNGHHHWHFPLIAGLLSFGINLCYACIGKGASCSSLALALGLNAFSATIQRRSSRLYPSPLCFTVTVFILGCTPVFPFDSVVALTAAVVIGILMGLTLFTEDPERSDEPGDDVYRNGFNANEEPTKNPANHMRWKLVQGLGALYCLQYILVLLRVPSPEKHNMYPYLTGCGLVYSDRIGDFVNAYANNANNDGRSLGEDDDGGEDYFDGQNMCAQMCLPHLVYRPALWGAQKFASLPLAEGTCEENGYEEHIADKTFHEFTLTFEVQLYTASNDNN